MNKTVNINIGGIFFHIDEDAYQKLSRYFDAIKRSLSNSSGKDEIMKDIEMRVAELFTDRQKSDKHVINLKDVDAVVDVMGQPEDYKLDNDEETNSSQTFNNQRSKKFYRDKDNGIIGGVCTGLGHYFGVDSIWIKILFLIFVLFGFGTGILAYFILWIITPKAVTTAEKLEMTGEAVNISNIEKKVREEFDNVSNKIKNVDYDKVGNEIKSGAQNVGNRLGDVLTSIFGAFAKVLGAFIVVCSSFLLLGITISGIVLMFSSALPENRIIEHISTPLSLETPFWVQGILLLLVFGIPVFFILYVGLKLLVTNLKSINSVIKYGLLAVWIIAVGLLISIGIKEVGQAAYDGKVVKKEIINIEPTDTLYLKFKNNDFYSKNVNSYADFRLTQDEDNKMIIYSNNVSIEVLPTDETIPYLQIEKLAKGKTASDAKERAERIKYSYQIVGNKIILDNYIISDIKNKFRAQSVEIFLYLPKGTLFKPSESLEIYDQSEDGFFNLHHSGEYTYKVTDNKVLCLDCPPEENEWNDVDEENNNEIQNDSTSTIQFNKDGVLIKKEKNTSKNSEEIEEVKINKEGVTIKTK
jgi:phage shock protein PspC (stress-responsive transcriptional regulator)